MSLRDTFSPYYLCRGRVALDTVPHDVKFSAARAQKSCLAAYLYIARHRICVARHSSYSYYSCRATQNLCRATQIFCHATQIFVGRHRFCVARQTYVPLATACRDICRQTIKRSLTIVLNHFIKQSSIYFPEMIVMFS